MPSLDLPQSHPLTPTADVVDADPSQEPPTKKAREDKVISDVSSEISSSAHLADAPQHTDKEGVSS